MHFATGSIYRLHDSLRPFFLFPMFKTTQNGLFQTPSSTLKNLNLFTEHTCLVYTHSVIVVMQAISLVRCFSTALGGEYKAEQNRCRELGVCQRFRVRTFLKIQEYPSVDDLEGKKRLHGL